MALVLNLDVRWLSGRLVHVSCRMLPMVGYRSAPSDGKEEDELLLDYGDVASLESFVEYITNVTRISINGGHVRIIGLEREIKRIVELLGIEGPPPDPIPFSLER